MSLLEAKGGSSVLGGLTNFYHNGYNHRGGHVRNLAGDEWFASGDGRYTEAANTRQREIILKATAASLEAVLNAILGRPNQPNSTYAATRFLPVHYWGSQEPVHPEHQVKELIALTIKQQELGESLLDTGFDFTLGILKYLPHEKKGDVSYLKEVRDLQGR